MLEKLKAWMQRRIEKNAVVSEIDGKKVILKKGSIFGCLAWIPIIGELISKNMAEWGQIYTPLDESTLENATNEDGVVDWKKVKWNIGNVLFGGWRNFARLLILMLLLIYAYVTFSGLLGDAREYMDGSKYVIVERKAFEKFCETSIIENKASEQVYNMNWSGLKFEEE